MQPAFGGQVPLPTTSAPAPASAFTVGRVISRTFSTWRHHVVVFSILTLIAYLPIAVMMAIGGAAVVGAMAPNPSALDPAAAPPVVPPGLWLAYLASMLLFVVEVGAMTHGVIHHLAGKRVSLGAMISVGLRRALPLLVVGLICYVLFLVGLMLLLVPGIYFACAVAAAIPAVVVERPGVLGALKRSFALTQGKRLAILAVFLVLFGVAFGITVFGSAVLPQLLASFSPLAGVLLSAVVNIVFGTILWVAPGVVYHDLRVAKEGVATEQLAAIFE